MKILLIRTSAAENTIFKNIYNEQEVGLAKELTRLGHECGIVYYAQKGNTSQQEIEVENKKIKIYNIEGKVFIKSALYNEEIFYLCEQYDILQVYECDKVMSWKIYSKFPHKTILYHGPYQSKFTWKHNIYTKIFYKIFKHRNNYLNANIITKSVLAEKYLKKQRFKNVRTIGVGLDKEKIKRTVHSKNEFINKLIKEKQKNLYKYLLYIGKIEKRRNIKFLLNVLKENNSRNIKLIIVGNGNANYIEKCFNYAKKIGVFDKIIYEKSIKQEELAQIYQLSDIFLLPTKYEIFGMVLLEAMYFGIPTITTLNGGSSTLIDNRENGIICDLDLKKWNSNINELLNNDIYYNKISINASRKIKEEFTWDKMSQEFMRIYEENTKA